MARIFICYRREDTSGYAGRLRDALAAQFGGREIFRDIETIEPGADFVAAMSAAIAECRVFLVLIGRRWLDSGAGGRRIDNADDHVRREVAAALAQDIRIIPVLLDSATMPRSTDLPQDLRGLASRNAISLDDEDWESDVQRLAASIRRELQAGGPGTSHATGAHEHLPRAHEGVNRRASAVLPNRSVLVLAGAALIGIVAIVGSAVLDRSPEVTEPEPQAQAAIVTRDRDATPTAAAPTGAETEVSLPAGGAAEVGEGIFELLSAGVRRQGDGSQLRLGVRLTNRGRYDALFSDGIFRLLVDDQANAPAGGLSQVVPSDTSRDAELTFELTSTPKAARLQITAADEKGEIPLDLSGGTGPTAREALEARRAGKTTAALPVDASTARLRFGELVFEVRAATLREFANKRTLTLSMRARNGGPYPAAFGDGYFRLLIDDHSSAPVGGLSIVVPGQADREGELLFDVPLGARRAVLRGRYGDVTADLPLEFPPRFSTG